MTGVVVPANSPKSDGLDTTGAGDDATAAAAAAADSETKSVSDAPSPTSDSNSAARTLTSPQKASARPKSGIASTPSSSSTSASSAAAKKLGASAVGASPMASTRAIKSSTSSASGAASASARPAGGAAGAGSPSKAASTAAQVSKTPSVGALSARPGSAARPGTGGGSKATSATPSAAAATSGPTEKARAKARSAAANAAAAQLALAAEAAANGKLDDSLVIGSGSGSGSMSPTPGGPNMSTSSVIDAEGKVIDETDPAFLEALTASLQATALTDDTKEILAANGAHNRKASLGSTINTFLENSIGGHPTTGQGSGKDVVLSPSSRNPGSPTSARHARSPSGRAMAPKSPSHAAAGAGGAEGGKSKRTGGPAGGRVADAIAAYEKRVAEANQPSLADIAAEQRRQLEAYNLRTKQLASDLEGSKKRADTAELEVGELKTTLANETNRLETELQQCKAFLAEAQAINGAQKVEIAGYKEQILKYQARILAFEEQLRLGDAVRRYLHNQVLELKGNIRVFCRVRPHLPSDHVAQGGNSGKPVFSFPVTTASSLGGMIVSSSSSSSTTSAPSSNDPEASPSSPSGSGDSSSSSSSSSLSSPDSMTLTAAAMGLTERNTLIFRQEGKSVDGSESSKKQTFTFDRVFTPEDGNAQVFEEVSQLVQSALDGYKICIFAYGQTGSGKTYTMEGEGLDQLVAAANANATANPPSASSTASSSSSAASSGGSSLVQLQFPASTGITARSVYTVFAEIAKMRRQGWNHRCRVHIFEVYNDDVLTLLPSGVDDEGKQLPCGAIAKKITAGWEPFAVEIKSNQSGGGGGASGAASPPSGGSALQSVSGCEPVQVSSSFEVFGLLAVASAMRRVRDTAMNSRSSRSHCVFQMFIEGRCDKTQEVRQGMINLVDLAGSERIKQSQAEGAGLDEAVAINKSLSALGDVIVALGNGKGHVPFRNSRLTFLLQNCFGSDSKTLMLVNLSPAEASTGESLCSLRFATKVNNCHIGVAQKNVKHS